MSDAYQIVRDFEQALCDYTGAPYCVTTDSCSNAILLSLVRRKSLWPQLSWFLTIPKRTYPSVANMAIHAGWDIEFMDFHWKGKYQLLPTEIWDCAKQFKRHMYVPDTIQCISFHGKKHLPIGRGGAILTNDLTFAEWARCMRFDGRQEGKSLAETELQCVGYNCYMTPEQAARGMELLQFAKDEYPEEYEPYQDLSKYEMYKPKVTEEE